MLKYSYILIVLYSFNLFLVSFINLMIDIINLFNYKNTNNFTKNKKFYDIFINFYNYNNNFKKISYCILMRK